MNLENAYGQIMSSFAFFYQESSEVYGIIHLVYM